MDVMGVLPPLVARRVERLKCINMERERVMEKYLGERAALETKYSDIYKPLYEERGNVVARHLDDEIKRIHKEGRDDKEEEGSKKDEDDGDDDVGEGDEREEAASLEDTSDDDKIYGAIASRGTTTTNSKATKAPKDDNDKEGHMVGILQFWVCAIW